jgi:hypothetical protein
MPDGEGDARSLPTFTAHRSVGSGSSFTPTASPRVRRRPSSWSPGPHGMDDSGADGPPTEARPALHRPTSTRFRAVFESRGIRHSFAIAIPSHLASAAGASGSTAPPLRCRDCSHPPRHLPDQAVPSFQALAATRARRGLSPRPVSRVGDWRGGCCSVSSPRRFKPYERFSRIRLSDIVHRWACTVAPRTFPVRRKTPSRLIHP